MADQTRKDAKRRASFARAERLKRTDNTTAKKQPQQAKRQPRQAQRSQASKGRSTKPQLSPLRFFAARSQRPKSHRTLLEQSRDRDQRTAARTKRQALQENTRKAFNRQSDRRRDPLQRESFAKRQNAMRAALKRVQDVQRKTDQRRQQLREQEIKRTFNRRAEDRKATLTREADAKRAAQTKAAQRVASLEIDREHKRRQADQQTQHRRETDQTRLRHQSATRSMIGNELTVEDRHRQAVHRLERAEQRELAAFDADRDKLKNRIVERITGTSRGDEQRAKIQERFDNERMAKHRQLEATKERLFNAAQTMRLQQARERLQLAHAHRTDRQQMQEQHQKDRPGLIEGRQNAIVQAERQRDERENTNERQHGVDRSWQIPASEGRSWSIPARVG